jgi:Raf kinase inhibitor-like YbhB/YbcL family protein
MAAFRLTSPAFEHDDELPAEHTVDGPGHSPPLEWSGVPEGTRELALICEDPDAEAGVFTHWIVYGLLPDTTGLPAGLSRDVVINEPVELVQGLNEFDEAGYTGPTPSDDRGPHRFFFRLTALDIELGGLPPGATRSELRAAAKGHILDTAELVGIV